MRIHHAFEPHGDARRGLAILTVLLVLLALLVMTTPFLMTARNASRSSSQFADRVQSRLALESAARHARADLGGSHPAIDPTPYWDDLEELRVAAGLDRTFLDPTDPTGVMWSVEVSDEAGKLDLNSAGPHLFANLMGGATRLTRPLEQGATEMTVSTTRGFPEVGFLWVGRELVGYTKKSVRGFGGLQRGLMAEEDAEGNTKDCGPQPPATHDPGAVVLDERAFGPIKWRTMTADGLPRRFDTPEHVREASLHALAGLDDEALAAISRHGTAYGDVRAGRRWQRPARLVSSLRGGLDCVLVLDQRRWFSPGTTVQISDGETTELGIVQELTGRGVRLMMPTVNDYEAYTAEVRALARRPVNVNVASPETLRLLLENLQLRGINERVTGKEAQELAALMVASRPFEGLEDFLRRVLLPAAGMEALPADAPVVPASLADGARIIDEYDAVAVYANALNSNDWGLAFSTLPFTFTSRDVYSLDLRATVNAPSGVARVTGRRDQVELIVPQKDLIQLWSRQEDFLEAVRLDAEAPWWATGPEPVSQWDGGAVPPSPLWPQMGTLEGKPYLPGVSEVPEDWGSDQQPVPEHVFPSREEDGFAAPWAVRVSEVGRLAGHVEHFDNETRDHEGRSLPDETETYDTTSDLLAWADPQLELLRALDLCLWIKPEELSDGVIFDIGQNSLESDRITLALEGPDLVLRVLDAVGDHPDTDGFEEAGEARLEIASGDGPGLDADTWTHVAIDVRGTRPDQITMLVDGQYHGVRQPGYTRLAQAVASGDLQIQIEDDEGFPQRGVVRIGREFIEYRLQGKNVLDATPQTTGELAGFGGRMARVEYTQGLVEQYYFNEVDDAHPVGAPVEVYGYTIPLASNAPGGSASLAGGLGRWAVGWVSGVDGGQGTLGDVISEQTVGNLGNGLAEDSQATGLVIEPCPLDVGMSPAHLEAAFSSNGGYAALIQETSAGMTRGTVTANPDTTGYLTPGGATVFGIEIIRYSGINGGILEIAERAALPGLVFKSGSYAPDSRPHAFVTTWSGEWQSGSAQTQTRPSARTYVAPISIQAPGASGSNFLLSDLSEFAQITHLGTDTERTEWFRYDAIVGNGHFVRNGAEGLKELERAISLTNFAGGQPSNWVDPTGPPPPGGGPPGGPGTKPMVPSPPAWLPPSTGPTIPQQGVFLWNPTLGVDEDDSGWVFTKSALTRFQFRGVFGTHQHDHDAGDLILPVFRVDSGGWDAGWPGRLDPILVVDEDPTALGWPATIHWRHWANDYEVYDWSSSNPKEPFYRDFGATPDDYLTQSFHVALQEDLGGYVPNSPVQSEAHALETRTRGRILKHPSGERPRIVDKAVLGGTIRGADIPGVVVDEVCFQSTDMGTNTPIGQVAEGGNLVLIEALWEGELEFRLNPNALRLAGRIYSHPGLIDYVPEDAALLRIGDEIVCVDSYDVDTGVTNVAPGGRALLGTTEQNHPLGSHAVFLESFVITTLSNNIDAGDDMIPLEDTAGFPQQGTVLIGDELIHYTRVRSGVLEMPRRSDVPGEMNRKGDGIFRGRYGTVPGAHLLGTPVMLFPVRYWDRYSDRADGPELAYFGLSVDQPNAFWRSVFFDVDEVEGAQIEVLQRSVDPDHGRPPPWDADPETTPGLDHFVLGMPNGEGNPINVQADRLEWRIFVRYAPGAFDPVNGLSTGWKRAPRLRMFGVEYIGPNQVLRRIDE